MDMKIIMDSFQENYYRLEYNDLKRLIEKNPLSEAFIRFFNELDDNLLGILCLEADKGKELHLLFAQRKPEYSSLLLPVPIENYRLADNLTIIFAQKVCQLYKESDFFNVFNTYQHKRQTALEALDYLAIFSSNIPAGAELICNGRLIPIQIIDRVKFLQEIFENSVDKPNLDPENKIYLMVDNLTGLIKIGHSKDPKFREGTLQSKKPDTHLIASWTAPKIIENELHKKYSEKRIRGEWFKLHHKDILEIKDFLDNL